MQASNTFLSCSFIYFFWELQPHPASSSAFAFILASVMLWMALMAKMSDQISLTVCLIVNQTSSHRSLNSTRWTRARVETPKQLTCALGRGGKKATRLNTSAKKIGPKHARVGWVITKEWFTKDSVLCKNELFNVPTRIRRTAHQIQLWTDGVILVNRFFWTVWKTESFFFSAF